jgi:hypothetical protein
MLAWYVKFSILFLIIKMRGMEGKKKGDEKRGKWLKILKGLKKHSDLYMLGFFLECQENNLCV